VQFQKIKQKRKEIECGTPLIVSSASDAGGSVRFIIAFVPAGNRDT
jgi:hypothetical protein